MRNRLSVVVRWMALLSAAFWNHAAVRAQVPPPAPIPAAPRPAPDANPAEPVSGRPSTRQLEKRFQRGRELLEEGNFLEGTRLLQSILESAEDDFFHPDADNKARERSLKFEAQSLLGEMSNAGRAVYEKQYGPAARRLLTDAVARNDTDQLGLVARRFFHTQAGNEAVYRLASDHLDHGHPLTAALCFERLRLSPQADESFEPLLTLKTALSWQRAGRDDKAIEVLSLLKHKYRRPSVILGGREVALFQGPDQALSWLMTALGPGPEGDAELASQQWTMVRGDARRNAESSGTSPYLNRGWRMSTVDGSTSSPEQDAVVARMLQERKRPSTASDEQAAVPQFSCFQPLVLHDLVVVRGIGDLRAYELGSGKLAWATGEKDQLLLEMLRTAGNVQTQVQGIQPLAFLIAQRAWDDATFGTISSDGDFVFAVEDIGLHGPLPFQMPRSHVARDYNRLAAYDARTGKAIWEAGGPRGPASDELAGAYFLGAPLILDRRLYALIESGSDVRLVVLEPGSGRLVWSQTLNAETDNSFDIFRRRSGLTPSYDGGILVCPTGAEQVTAVDLTGRSLLWRYKVRNRSETYDPRTQQILLQQPQLMVRMATNGGIDQNRWLDATAIISDARVVLSPRDSNELHCVNLLDGSLVWKTPRGDGLFVAGVHDGKVLVVGRTYMQALQLTDGKPAWTEPPTVPVPSGRGFVGGDHYHLPLSTGEVATIDLRDGRIVSRSRSLSDRVRGNLVAIAGAVVSQGADYIEAFKPLATLEAEIAEKLVTNPEDAESLTLRGEIRLQRGEFREAYVDLQRALELKTDELKSDDAAVRELLVGSLLEGMRVDFATYRQLPVDLDKLLIAPEQRSAYLWLQAAGLQRIGEVGAAFEALLKFADSAMISDREQERMDATLTVRRDRLVRSRAQQLYAAASLVDRKGLDALWQKRADALLDEGDSSATRRFLDFFGDLHDGHELARKVVLAPTSGEWLSDEFLLRRFDESAQPDLAAAATARLTSLLLTAERPRDAALLMTKIERRWPATASLDGRSGADLVAEWNKRPEVERALAPNPSWPTGRVDSEREPNPGNNVGNRTYTIPLEGDRRPFFTDVNVEISSSWQHFIARDDLGRQIWKVSLDAPIPTTNFHFNRAYVRDHLLVVSIGPQVIAIDTLGTAEQPGARILWRVSLVDSSSPGAIVPRNLRGMRGRMPFVQMGGAQLGTVGPLTRSYLAVLRERKLQALDPLTGKPLWIRDGIPPGSDLFGDEELLFVVPPEATAADVYRALDGSSLGVRPLATSPVRLDTVGRNAILWQKVDGRQVLTVHDVAAEKALWKKDFADGAWVALIESDEAAVVEPDGKFTILSLADGSVSRKSAIAPPANLQQIFVLRSREHYLLIGNERPDQNGVGNAPWIQVLPQSMPVTGFVHGFDRGSGKKLWSKRVVQQGLDPYQPAGLPILTFVIQLMERSKTGAGVTPRFGMMCVDKRTGRTVFDEQQANEQLSYVDVAADIDQHQIELRLLRSTVRLTFTDKPWPQAP